MPRVRRVARVALIGPEDPRDAEYLPLALSEEEQEAYDRENKVAGAQLLARWVPVARLTAGAGLPDLVEAGPSLGWRGEQRDAVDMATAHIVRWKP